MSGETVTLPVSVTQAVGSGLMHTWCCHDEDLALCGADISGEPEGWQPGDVACAVCEDLDEIDCTDECVCLCCVEVPRG